MARTQDGKIVSESEGGLEFSLTQDGKLNFLDLGSGIFPAMRKALKTMRKGEKAQVSVKYSCK